MTLSEALKAFASVSEPSSFKDSVWIERFVALGMLKLDEPKTFTEKLFGVAGDNRIVAGGARDRALNLPDLFNEYGLKIVEK